MTSIFFINTDYSSYIFFLVWASVVCAFQNISPFHLNCRTYWNKVVHNNFLSIFRLFTDWYYDVYFISNIGNLYIFLSLNLNRGLLILLIFSKHSLWFHLFSLLFFCLLFYWFFILFPPLLISGLLYSSLPPLVS